MKIKHLFVIWVIVLFPSFLFAQDAALKWEAINVAGYKIHYGTTTGVYPNVIDAGNTTAFLVTGLQPETTYYFVITAYDASGNESAPSPEASATTLSLCSTQLVSIAALYWGSIQAAYDTAKEGDVIRVLAKIFPERVAMNRAIAVTMEGGYSCGFSDRPGTTIIDGSLTVEGGAATLSGITIQ
ncbi:MAG: fibronectin type III domain-containing protein [Nitrospiraceae bacterium]|nr:fibronectin type III domain-containing protein [Nitrospiraceae bacterium]